MVGYANFRRMADIDLNLLIALDALLAEGSVGGRGAALGPQCVSNEQDASATSGGNRRPAARALGSRIGANATRYRTARARA